MRQSGILLHLTSLPGPEGIGTLGEEARAFVDFLRAAGMRLWQVLPIGPTGYGESPYQCFSTYAGNPLLIDLRTLEQEGLLKLKTGKKAEKVTICRGFFCLLFLKENIRSSCVFYKFSIEWAYKW